MLIFLSLIICQTNAVHNITEYCEQDEIVNNYCKVDEVSILVLNYPDEVHKIKITKHKN